MNLPSTEKEIELYLILKQMERLYSVLRVDNTDNRIIEILFDEYVRIKEKIKLLKQYYIRVYNDEVTDEIENKLFEDYTKYKK